MPRLITVSKLLLLLLTLSIVACNNEDSTTASNSGKTATVLVGLQHSPVGVLTGDPADLAAVASITLTVSAKDMSTLTVSLPLNGDTIAIDVPAGINRVFSAVARDASDVITHRGSTTLADLIAGSRVRVNLTLDPVGPDTTAPTVTGTSPIGGATAIAINSIITVTFSEAIDPATIDAAMFTVSGATGTVSYSGTTATFTPDALAYATTYTVTLGTGITDLAGNTLAAPYSWTFTTGAAPDTTPPTISATTPTDGATNVDPGTSVTVTFSEAMDPTTINDTTFTVTGTTGTVSYSGTTATFAPAALAYGTSYTVTLNAGVTDAAGNALAADYTFSFTTIASSSAPTFSGLTLAAPSSSTTVDIAWEAATDDVSASAQIIYDISVATTPAAPFNADYTTVAGATNYTITGLTEGTDYYIVVRARDEAGNSDTNTIEAHVMSPIAYPDPTGPPPTIYDLKAYSISGMSNRIMFYYYDFSCGDFTLDFGDGTSDFRSCPQDGGPVYVDHAYTAPGTYTVTLSEPLYDIGLVQTMTLTLDRALPSLPPSRIVAGGSQSMAVRADGVAYAWGTNNGGVLGTGATTYFPTTMLNDVYSMDGKAWFSVAIKFDGSVWAWGWGPSIGLPSNDNLYPAAVAGLSNIIAISSGYNHSLVLRKDGAVFGFGDESNNVFGTPIGDNTVRQVSGVSGIIAVAAGEQHSLALKSDGTVLAWGNNNYGQLGDGTTTAHADPAAVTGLDNVVAIAAGSWHSVALKTDGTVWTWGYNWNGQVGDSTYTDRSLPVQVLSNVTAISTGNNHSLALMTDGTVMSWGYNADGQLGDNSSSDRNIPVAVSTLTNVVEVDGGEFHSIARLTDGSIWTWGRNSEGVLGDGTTNNSYVPIQVPALNVNP